MFHNLEYFIKLRYDEQERKIVLRLLQNDPSVAIKVDILYSWLISNQQFCYDLTGKLLTVLEMMLINSFFVVAEMVRIQMIIFSSSFNYRNVTLKVQKSYKSQGSCTNNKNNKKKGCVFTKMSV